MELAPIGDFVNYQLAVIHVVNILLIAVLLVMGISLATMIVVRLLSKRKHKYKDERSMDRLQ